MLNGNINITVIKIIISHVLCITYTIVPVLLYYAICMHCGGNYNNSSYISMLSTSYTAVLPFSFCPDGGRPHKKLLLCTASRMHACMYYSVHIYMYKYIYLFPEREDLSREREKGGGGVWKPPSVLTHLFTFQDYVIIGGAAMQTSHTTRTAHDNVVIISYIKEEKETSVLIFVLRRMQVTSLMILTNISHIFNK